MIAFCLFGQEAVDFCGEKFRDFWRMEYYDFFIIYLKFSEYSLAYRIWNRVHDRKRLCCAKCGLGGGWRLE